MTIRALTGLALMGLVATGSAASAQVPLLRLPATPREVPAGGTVLITPLIRGDGSPVRATVQVDRGTGWHSVATVTITRTSGFPVRLNRPGRVRLRLALANGVTNAVPLVVRGPYRRRVAAGAAPAALAAHGRDLWVLGGTPSGRAELRLLDATTGRLRRGPVILGGRGASLALVDTGRRVLLAWHTADGSRLLRLDGRLPRLVGPEVARTAGGCGAVCTGTTLTVEGAVERPQRTGEFAEDTVTGPDGRVWGLTVSYEDEGGGVGANLLEAVEGGPPADRGVAGLITHHGGFSAEMIAVRGGLWYRGAMGLLRWFGSSGPGVEKGTFQAIRGAGTCVWGLGGQLGRPSPDIRRLVEGPAPNGPAIPSGFVTVDDTPAFAVGPGAAWIIPSGERALERIPIPDCRPSGERP